MGSMNHHPDFTIQYGSYSIGKHPFEFEIVNSFFDSFPESDIKKAKLIVELIMNRQDRHLEFDLQIKGDVLLPCDRCLEEFAIPVNAEYKLYGKFGEGRNDNELDVLWIPSHHHQVNLMQHFYEYVILSIPIRRFHPDKSDGSSGCNPEMISFLENYQTNEIEE